MNAALLVLLVLLIGAACAAYAAWTGRVIVPADHVGIVRRRYGWRADPTFKQITPQDLRGLQARTLLPDRICWFFPGIYSIEFVPRVDIPEGMIGLVVAQEGRIRPADRPLGRQVDCDNFQDGQAFLLRGGEQGRQVTTLVGDQSYYINTKLFQIEIVSRTYVPPGTVGLVIAKAGRVRAPDQPFGRHVECDYFQNGQAFLDGGGEQGKQLAVLAGGTYYDINTALFKVVTTHNVADSGDDLTANQLQEIAIPIGTVGVVITLDGAEPERGSSADGVGPLIDGHRSFRLPWGFLERGGRRGVQQETLSEGTVCALNPWLIRVVLVPTRVLILEWTNKGVSESRNFDAELERITVTVQGHRVHVNLDQTLKIPEAAAPKLISAFGETDTSKLGGLIRDPVPVQRFVEKVLGATVTSYFSGIAAGWTTIEEFLLKYAEARTDLSAQVRNALLAWGVEAINTNLGSFEVEDQKLNEELQREASAQLHSRTLDVELGNARVEDEIDKVRVLAERRRAALELEAVIDALGRDNVAMIRMVREIAKMKVPEVIGGDISSYAQMLPMPALQNLISRLCEMRTDHRQLKESDALPELTEAETVQE